VDKEELVNKLAQIEEQATLTLAEPQTLTRERMRMIISLARHLRTGIGRGMSQPEIGAGQSDNEETLPKGA